MILPNHEIVDESKSWQLKMECDKHKMNAKFYGEQSIAQLVRLQRPFAQFENLESIFKFKFAFDC